MKLTIILGSILIIFVISIPFIEERGQRCPPKVYPERMQDTIKPNK